MADFGGPSFSLGLDLDFDSNPDSGCLDEADPGCAPNSSDDECFNPGALNTCEAENPRPALKRLKRGPGTPSSVASTRDRPLLLNVDDEIEEFSSQEDLPRGEPLLRQTRSACSSSKFSLPSQRVLTTHSANEVKDQTNTSATNAPPNSSVNSSGIRGILPRITISPLRKIQLLDSDSDNPPTGDNQDINVQDAETPIFKQSNATQPVCTNRSSGGKFQVSTSTKDFGSTMGTAFATPALDEFCEGYFRSMNETVQSSKKRKETEAGCSKSLPLDSFMTEGSFQDNREFHWNQANPLPPAYRYCNHSDPLIRKLVCDRLPNYSPVGAVDHRDNHLSDAPVIDYMSQFGHRDTPAGTCRPSTKVYAGSSMKGNTKRTNTKATSQSQASEGWVNPKNCASVPKDAGKRRIHAEESSRGHWYTGQGGVKVYVTKNGQELTGRLAYRHYKKESGGFRKSRKKSAPKKKSKTR